MKHKKYTFTEAYNRIPYNEMKGFRAKAKKVLGVKSDNQFCNYKLGKSNLRLNQYAGLVALFAEYGIKDPIKETKTKENENTIYNRRMDFGFDWEIHSYEEKKFKAM